MENRGYVHRVSVRKKILSPKSFPLILSEVEITHKGSLVPLESAGVAFHSPTALEIFTRHGFKTEGETIY